MHTAFDVINTKGKLHIEMFPLHSISHVHAPFLSLSLSRARARVQALNSLLSMHTHFRVLEFEEGFSAVTGGVDEDARVGPGSQTLGLRDVLMVSPSEYLKERRWGHFKPSVVQLNVRPVPCRLWTHG
jgi:hypothetical protein